MCYSIMKMEVDDCYLSNGDVSGLWCYWKNILLFLVMYVFIFDLYGYFSVGKGFEILI